MSNTHGWKAALDVQMDVLKWHSSTLGALVSAEYYYNAYTDAHNGDGDSPELRIYFEGQALAESKLITETLWRGDTCYVTSDMLHLVLQAAHDMPLDEIHIDFKNLMTPMGFVLMEEPIAGVDVNGEPVVFHAMAWNAHELAYNLDTSEQEKALRIYFFSHNSDPSNAAFIASVHDSFPDAMLPPMCILHTYQAFDGHVITHRDGQGYEIVEELLKVFYSIQLLSHQTIGQPIQLRPDRSTRKRFARAHPDEPERLITLITLRRKTTKKDDEEPKKVEWSRRWVVRGFWRKQWYPKTKTHDWKYIHEYIKGPEDKPLIITERRVFDFRR